MEQAASEAAASAAPAADFGFDEQREEDEHDVFDGDVVDDVPCDGTEGVGLVGEPESEPEGEPAVQDDTAEPGVDIEADDEVGGTVDTDVGLPVEAARDVVPALIPEVRPTLEQYMEKWARLLAQHNKKVPGEFSNNNLVPKPIDALWQACGYVFLCSGKIIARCRMARMFCEDCPHVPFAELKSEEAQARLSVCKPISGLQETTRVGGIERYAHQAGDVFSRCSVCWRCDHARASKHARMVHA